MEKLTFKNTYVNIVIGVLFIVLAFLGYFLQWFEDFLPLFIGFILLLLSLKRFVHAYKKNISKNATLILVIELLLDFVFVGLLIYMQSHIEVFIGLIIYIRGVAYLLINYIATRKIHLKQYILNIGYVTLGSFLIFYPLNSLQVLVIGLSVLILLIGVIYLYAGIQGVIKKRTPKETPLKTPSPYYAGKTMAELKTLAKERNLHGVSHLNKSQLIDTLKETENH